MEEINENQPAKEDEKSYNNNNVIALKLNCDK
jgi:hypothetical protein